jgi:formylglycine-generating enzyme required for sulfatase activity
LCIEGRDLAGNIQSTPTNYSWTKGTPAGFVKIEKAVSGLAYEYFIMQYEASLESGSFGADSISNDGADLKRCNYEFHVNLDSFHASCGTKASTAVPQSVSGQAPIAGVTWHQAFATCRNLSSSAYLVRLATREEWLRAAKWTGSDYTAMWNTYTADCKVSGGTADTTGNSANCKNGLNLFDVAGNVAEWVDMRMLQYDIAANGEERFFYGPVIGNLIDNGIDGFTRRFHLIDPGAAGLALAMGANFATPTLADRKQYGDDVHAWLDPTSSPSSAGFRCVAFSKSNSPTLAELSLPSEPLYTAADLPAGNTANWKIPENLYENDTRYEELSIVVNGNTSDSAAEGEVTITWRPWSKEVCNDATCSAPQTLDNFTYRLYRFREPTHQSIRLATPWALSGGPYLTDENLDPLLASANNDLIAAISNCTTATAGNCTFTDNTTAGTSFSPTHYYRYLLVALDAGGNAMPAQVQRFHSPFFAGDPALAGAQSFRLEPRYRKAAVFLVDEEHQQAKAAPQIMVHVPMDKSGLDHDFFIQKYEGTLATGGVNNNATNANNPLSFDSGNGYSWLADAAKCHDKFLQTGGTIDATLCGTNSTIATVKSAQAFAPLVSIDQGAYWRACRKTSYADGDGNNYRLILPSSAEWNKAADWGDVDLDGTIDQHVVAARVGETIHGGVEYSGAGADAVTVRCHSDNNPGSPYNSNSAETTTCRSRYGMADHVGNIWEWVSDRHYSGAGLDNGLAGLWLDHATKTSNGQNSAPAGFDLLRGSVPADKTAGAEIASALNGDNYWYNTTLRGVFRGGRWSTAADAGRWSLYAAVAPSYVDTSFGGRCAVP